MTVATWVDPVTDAPLLDVEWADRPDDDVAQELLDASHVACLAFLGAEPAEVAANHKLAELLQARSLHRAGYVGSGNAAGGDFPVTVFPMDWTVKSLLRPQPGIPGIF